MPKALRLSLAVLVLLCAAAAGFYLTLAFAPERLHRLVESWLTEATRAEAEVASLRLVMGFPIRLEGTGLRLYDGALTVEKASARLDVAALLVGRPRLSRLRLDGAHLQVDRTPEGTWEPPIFGKPRERERAEPALEPLRVIEGVTRALLSRPLLADTLIVRRSRVSLVHPRPAGAGEPVRLVFREVNGRLLHSRLFGDARLFLRVRVETDGEERGRLEWNGTRDDEGVMRATMAATGLDLSTLEPYVRLVRPTAHLRGQLDGIVDFETLESGVGSLDLDWQVRDLTTSLAHEQDGTGLLRLPSLSVRMGVGLDHERVRLSDARFGAGELDFALDADIARPLHEDSASRVVLSLGELALQKETALTLASWLPTTGREALTQVAERVRSGRLRRAELRGTAPVSRWRQLVAGGLERLPAGFRFAVVFDGVSLDVDETNRLDALEASLAFEDDVLTVADASGLLNGGPLPSLAVRFERLSLLLAARRQEREMVSSAKALLGLTPLFEVLRGDRDPDAPRSDPPKIEIAFDHLHHPALLWPLRDVRVDLVLQPEADGFVLQVEDAGWAGVFLDGEVDWTLRPERHLDIRLVATEQADGAPLPGIDDVPGPAGNRIPAEDLTRPWVEGRFSVGPIDSPRWTQSGASGRFSAEGGLLRIEDIEIAMQPSGRVVGFVDLDLTRADAVPYQADLGLEQADVATLIEQRGASQRLASGTLDASAQLAGTLLPGGPLLHDADGVALLEAREGAIARSVPPVLALALASSSLNPFSSREELRYAEAAAGFTLETGRMSTTGLEIEGPDIRLFASGDLDLAQSPPELDAEVALFLFRQLDATLDLIPILNVLMLGENENLIAAYFQLDGPWGEPVASSKPLRTLSEGPGAVLTKAVPRVMMRGMKAIGGIFGGAEEEEAAADLDAEASPDGNGDAAPAPAP
ncbi:MAG: AsmA-like C-terminal region-containing protein [Myxococcota bacterium]